MASFYYDVLETIAEPEWVLEGYKDELWAMRRVSAQKAMVVIYKEIPQKND